MEVAASITAFLSIALESTKVVCEIISSIRHGPDTIRQAVADLDSLHRILWQLQRDGDTIRPTGNLSKVVKECAIDMQEFQSRTSKLSVRHGAGLRRRLWTSIKATI